MGTPEKHIDVFLTCGSIEAKIGELAVPIRTQVGPAEGDAIPFAIEMDMPVFLRRLAALLRQTAELMESEETA